MNDFDQKLFLSIFEHHNYLPIVCTHQNRADRDNLFQTNQNRYIYTLMLPRKL